MAFYKDASRLSKVDLDTFDEVFSPGQKVIYSGIYRCQGCNSEVAANGGDPFPPQNHHQHSVLQGTIRWQLLVLAHHKS